MDRLAHKVFDAALVLPFEHPMIAPPPLGFKGGLVVHHEVDVPFRHLRYGKPVDTFPAPEPHAEMVQGKYTYAGMVYPHFGHTMSELIHRVLPTARRSSSPKWVLVSHKDHLRDIPRIQKAVEQIYAFVGVDLKDAFVVFKPTKFEQLEVSVSGSHMGRAPLEPYLDLLDEYTNQKLHSLFPGVTRPEKLYVSKSSFGPTAGLLGERYFESCLEEEGYFIFRPEQYRFSEQMDFYRKAQRVIFLEGSACHGTELLGRGLGKWAIIARRPNLVSIFSVNMSRKTENLSVYSDSIFVGSAVADPRTGNSMPHMGTTILRKNTIESFLRDRQLAELRNFDHNIYMKHAKEDFAEYIIRNRSAAVLPFYNKEIKVMLDRMYLADTA